MYKFRSFILVVAASLIFTSTPCFANEDLSFYDVCRAAVGGIAIKCRADCASHVTESLERYNDCLTECNIDTDFNLLYCWIKIDG